MNRPLMGLPIKWHDRLCSVRSYQNDGFKSLLIRALSVSHRLCMVLACFKLRLSVGLHPSR